MAGCLKALWAVGLDLYQYLWLPGNTCMMQLFPVLISLSSEVLFLQSDYTPPAGPFWWEVGKMKTLNGFPISIA